MTIVSVNGTVSERLDRLAPIVEQLRSADAAADRDRTLQYEAVDALRKSGVLGLRIPACYGGPGGSARDVLTAVISIASGSSNVAQALRAHYGFCERLLSNRANERERLVWFARINDGVLVGNAITDAKGAVPGSTATTVLPDSDGTPRLNGAKFYSTGSLYADLIAVSAVDGDGNDLQAIVPVDRDGVELFDDWDGFGQRVTASGTTRFTDVRVDSTEIVTVSDGRQLTHATSFLQLYLAAVAAGIAVAVGADAVEFVRHRARLAAHSLVTKATDDPFILRAAGEIAALASAAEALVLSAADVLDDLVDRGAQADHAAVAAAAVAVAQAQLIAERLTLSAAEKLFDTGGASATARSLNLDRHWRNARTLASHSPLDYKAHAVGNYAVNGVFPPATGYF